MTARTRYFFIASFLVLTVGVGTGLLAYYVGLPAGAPGEGPDELRLVPQGAIVVTYADVRQGVGSELYRKMRQTAQARQNGPREFEEGTGINVETDIDRVVACLDPQDAANAPSSGLMLARGRFNEVKIEALMREHGAQVDTYKSKRLIVAAATPRKDSSGKSEPFVVAFIEPGLAAMGNPQLVRAAIDLQQGGSNVTSNLEVMRLVRSVDGSNAWAVGRLDALRATAKLPPAMADRLPAITWFSVSGHVDTGLNGVIRAEAADENAASNLRDVVRGIVAMAKLQAAANPAMQALAESLHTAGEGRTVSLSFALSSDVLDTLSAARTLHAPTPHGH
jgi:hypothetical protein